jgi:SSS family solute:Na+ symporter
MIDTIVVAVYLALVLAAGLWKAGKLKTLEEYAVARRSYGALVIFATMSASFIGGGFSIGNAEKVFLFGVANIVALWGFSLKEILVARVIAPRMDRFPNAISIGDIMVTTYGKIGKVVSGIFAVMLCAGIVGAQVAAIGYIFNVFFGMEQQWGIAVGCGIVIAYTTFGGMRAVIVTDLFQFAILAIGIPLTLVFGITYIGGIDELVRAVPTEHLQIPGPEHSWLALIALFLVFLLGETLVPPYVQRLCIGRNAAEAARGTFFSGLFSIPFFAVTGVIGLVALAIDPALDSNLALPHVVATVMPPVLKGLVVAGVISIVMSSADSFLNSASIAFVNDLVRPLSSRELSKTMCLTIAKVATLVVGVLSVVFAMTIESVIDILIYAYTYWAPVILVPLIATVLGFRKGPRTFCVAAAAGLVAALVWNEWLDQPGGIEGLVIGVLANLVCFVGMIERRSAAPSAEAD